MKCVLHIGTEKTGTTSIQKFLAENRERLLGQGVAFLGSTGANNDLGLAFACCDEDQQLARFNRLGLQNPEQRTQWREALLAALAKELAELPPDTHTVIFSSEQFQSRLIRDTEVERLQSILNPLFSAFSVIVYLRRQDQLAVSLYSTALKAGYAPETILPATPTGRNSGPVYFNYRFLLRRWATAFGRGNIQCALFDEALKHPSGLIGDFCGRAGINHMDNELVYPVRENESLCADAQGFYLFFNRAFGIDRRAKGSASRFRYKLNHYLSTFHSGKPRLPGRAQARAFYRQFEANNAVVAREYFQLEQLFDENFDDYPSEEPPALNSWFNLKVLVGFTGYTFWRYAQRACYQCIVRPARKVLRIKKT